MENKTQMNCDGNINREIKEKELPGGSSKIKLIENGEIIIEMKKPY